MAWAHRKGSHLSPEARARRSARMRGKHHRHRGHKLSAATRAKLSKALKGRHRGGWHRRGPHRGRRVGHRGHHKGHKLSAATRAKISAALRGRHHKGHAMSQATRAKISAKLRARHPGAVHKLHRHTGKHHPHAGHGRGKHLRRPVMHHHAHRRPGHHRPAAHTHHLHLHSSLRPRKPHARRHTMRHHRGVPRPNRTHKPMLPHRQFRSGAHRLITAHAYKRRTGIVTSHRFGRGHHIVIRRRVNAHRVWRKKKR